MLIVLSLHLQFAIFHYKVLLSFVSVHIETGHVSHLLRTASESSKVFDYPHFLFFLIKNEAETHEMIDGPGLPHMIEFEK